MQRGRLVGSGERRCAEQSFDSTARCSAQSSAITAGGARRGIKGSKGYSTAARASWSIGKTMSDPTQRKDDDVTVLAAPKRGNPLMRAGAPSLNPRGRPKVGQSLAEAMRAHFSPQTIIELAESLTRSEDDRVRMVALQFIAERSWGKASATPLDDNSKPPPLPGNWQAMRAAERAAYLEAMRAGVRMLPSTTEDDEVSE
jgi:hypothetical protein